MAQTYQYLPLSIRDIFAELVTEVSDNLSTEDDLSIDQVSFKCETWIELIKRVQSEDLSTTHRSTKYPLIALIRNFDEKYNADSYLTDVSLTLVIVTLSDPNKLSEDRESDNYVPILRPIYAELMEVIKGSNYFTGYYNLYPSHTKTESFQLGQSSESGNTKYVLPDCVDGIIVSDLALKVRRDRCSTTVTGPAVSTVYLNNVSELSGSATTTQLTITFVSAGYTDTANVGYGASPQYMIHTDTEDTDSAIVVEGTHVISSVGIDNGYYTGYIYCDDGVTESKLYFFYYILDGRIMSSTEQSKMVLQNFTTTGFYYTDYPFDVVTRFQNFPGAYIARQSLSIDGGNELWSDTYQPVTADTGTDTNKLYAPLTTTYRDVVDEVTIGSDEAYLYNISYYKQQ